MNTNSRALMLNDTERMNYLREIEHYVDAHGGVVEVPELVCLYLTKK